MIHIKTKLEKSFFNCVNSRCFLIYHLLFILLSIFACNLDLSAQGSEENQNADTSNNKSDSNLRSIARINPSTLAMEFSIPLTSYPGRAGNSMPLSFSYSSKVWQMESHFTWWYTTAFNRTKFVTDVRPKFSERSAAGWTSSLLPPRIDEKLEIYDQHGKPFDFLFDSAGITNLYAQQEDEILNGNTPTSLLPQPGGGCGTYCIGMGWNQDGCNQFGCWYVWGCMGWGVDTSGCDGGTWDDPDPTSPNNDPPKQTHYVKRVRIQMPGGSLVEFRKDDKIHGYCVGTNPSNPTNCEGEGEDTLENFLAIDGSGLRLNRTANESILYMPDGGKFIFPDLPLHSGSQWYATKYIDSNGNTSVFSQTIDTQNQTADNKWIDTLGNEIYDPIPHNWISQTQNIGSKDVVVPGLNGTTRTFKIKWAKLKDENTNETVLENPNQELAYETNKLCRGNLADPLPPTGSTNGVLFNGSEMGLRPCSSSTVVDNTIVGALFNPTVLSEISLPNGQKYQFLYNEYGEITKIIYPTQSYETFVYNKIVPLGSQNNAVYDQTNRGVVERKVYDKNGNLEQRWQYSAGYVINQYPLPTSNYTVKITASHPNNPLMPGMRTERDLIPSNNPSPGSLEGNFGFSEPRVGMPKETRSYDENGQLRSRVITEYIVATPRTQSSDPNAISDARATRDPRLSRAVSITIENGQALATLSKTEYDETGSTDPEFFSHLNAKRTKGYHYKVLNLTTAQTGSLETIAAMFTESDLASAAETDYTYNNNYKAAGFLGLPIESRVLNASNTNEVLAKTQTIYDNLIPAPEAGAYSEQTYSGVSSPMGCPTGQQTFTTCWEATSSSYRGRPTSSKLWDSVNGTWIVSHTQYDVFGNAVRVKDAIGNEVVTEFSNTYLYAYPTKVTTSAPDPDGIHGTDQTSTAESTYDFRTGLVLKAKNDFGQETLTEYNDDLLRPTKVSGVGSFIIPISETIYNDTNLTVTVRKQIDETNWDEAISYSDSLGRTFKTVAKDSQGDIIVETKYDKMGRVTMVSNPYRQGDTVLWSLTEYDELGRAKQSREPVANQNPAAPTGNILGLTEYGISSETGFVGSVVTTTDAAGKKGRAFSNALGQLVRVDEPDSTGNLSPVPQTTPTPSPSPSPTPIEPIDPCPEYRSPGCGDNLTGGEYPSVSTYYKYNAQGNMVEVTQGGQKRFFLYDSMGRLIRVRQPEQEVNTPALDKTDSITGNNQWTAGFEYDGIGNLIKTTDAVGNIIQNTYDKAGRVKTRTYSDGTPSVEYFYDGKGLIAPQTPNYAKGKLTKVTSSISETRYKLFDKFGRLTQMEQKTPFGPEAVNDAPAQVSSYEYDFGGRLIKEIYPSLREVKHEYEADGDLMRVFGKANTNATDKTYVNSFSYTASGGISRMRLGNGKWETAKFNDRLQITELGLGNSATDASVWKVNYEYGEIEDNGTLSTSKNTGNIARQTLSFAGLATPLVQTYRYDSLYRLKEAKETSNSTTNWTQSYNYDRYGNRTGFNENIGGIANNLTPGIDPLTNRFTSTDFTYDKNGNITKDISRFSQARDFVFNAENKQIEIKNSSGVSIGKYYYDGEGKRVKKVTDTETTVFVYSGGKLVAEYSTKTPPPNPTTSYMTTDHLGTPRVITDALGQVKSRRDFMPFGEELTINVGGRSTNLKYGGAADDVRQKFTGYQKDTETELDFAEARMYENRYARFTAVDPLMASGIANDPQSFNRYVYCTNSPFKYVDKSGMYPTEIHDKILQEAFPGATSAQLSAIQTGSRLVDTTFGTGHFISIRVNAFGGPESFSVDFPRTLIPSEAYKHSMIPAGMTKAEGVQKTDEYMTMQINKAISDQFAVDPNGNTISFSALTEFGKATHSMMDGISPAHRFFQPYGLEISKGPKSMFFSNLLQDIQGAIQHGKDESAYPSGQDLTANIRLLRLNLLTGLGDNVFRQLVPDEDQRQEIYDMVENSNGRFNFRTQVPISWGIGTAPYRGLSVPQTQTELDDLEPPPPLPLRRP